ncbi:Gfo/Idh/MocA family oxidoreductase [Psychrobacillus sp. FSL H8-0483]|uniref:Gfo/Idh/MocA family oxidoreductase n=1 Tax=Psychrobacillus sp. FSL H8-0483 TaxID=2921389 RepID=UPI00315AB7E8
MVTRIGLLGLSEGNGHPYSFSAIINGFDEVGFGKSGWDVIYNYVKKRDISEFGISNAKVTHIWTQNEVLSKNIAISCKIETVVSNYEDMIGKIDGVIIARDDYENHYKMARPFLESGIKVFIDKPLTLDMEELKYFKKYLLNGQLMSVAGLRFAKELDDTRAGISEFGNLKVIQSSIIINWEKYGIHIIDGVLGLLDEQPISIEFINSAANLYVVTFKSGLVWTINILEDAPKTFNIEVWGTNKRCSVEIEDNFTMFRRMLYRFVKLVEEEEVLYNPNNTFISIALLIAGRISKTEKRIVELTEIYSDIEFEGSL